MCFYFYLKLLVSLSTECIVCKHGHENACTNILKKTKEAHTFSPPEMPLVIICMFLGNGITTSVPISVRFTQMRGPNERVATALY